MNPLPSVIVKALLTLGLNRKQITVLNLLYSIGPTKVYDLSRQVKYIGRTELYSVLDELVSEGLVSTIKLNNVTYYELKSSEELNRWVNARKLKAQEKLYDCAESLDEVREFFEIQKRTVHTKPIFTHFESGKGMEIAHKNLSGMKLDMVCMYINVERILSFCPQYFTLLLSLLSCQPDLKARVIVESGYDLLPTTLSSHPQLSFLIKERSNEHVFKEFILLYMTDELMCHFNAVENEANGFQMTCNGFSFTAPLLDVFEKEWSAKSAPHLPSREPPLP